MAVDAAPKITTSTDEVELDVVTRDTEVPSTLMKDGVSGTTVVERDDDSRITKNFEALLARVVTLLTPIARKRSEL